MVISIDIFVDTQPAFHIIGSSGFQTDVFDIAYIMRKGDSVFLITRFCCA